MLLTTHSLEGREVFFSTILMEQARFSGILQGTARSMGANMAVWLQDSVVVNTDLGDQSTRHGTREPSTYSLPPAPEHAFAPHSVVKMNIQGRYSYHPVVEPQFLQLKIISK